MKAKNLFFGALTCLAFAACSNDDEPVVNGAQAEGENAYIAVQLVMPGGNSSTRAWNDTDNYAKGSDDETAVSTADFFFFNADGTKAQSRVPIAGNQFNEWESNEESTVSINKTSTAVLVLEDKVKPAYVVVVLNMPSALRTDYATLSDLRKTFNDNLSATGTGGKFVMSNSVYKKGEEYLYGTPITEKNIGYGATVAEARTNIQETLTIPVERVLARVTVGYKDSENFDYADNTITNIYDSDNNKMTTTVEEVVPYITGWWLHNTNKNSYLVKNYDDVDFSSFTATGSGLASEWWNDPTDLRSYWANAYHNSSDYAKYRYGAANNKDKYCFENTNSGNATTLMVAATLMRSVGGVMKSVDLVQWVNMNFLSANDFKKFAATRLASLGYTKKIGGTESAITADDLKFIYNVADDASTTSIDESQLNDKNWKTRMGLTNSEAKLVLNSAEITDVEAELLQTSVIGIFKYYNGGQTYFFTKIQHEPAYEETTNAIIRNHLYKLTIGKITGLGTPVPNEQDGSEPDPTTPTPTPDPENPEYPDPDDPNYPDPTDPDDPDQPIDPETPTDDHSAIDAVLQILKYRVVSQDVNLDNK